MQQTTQRPATASGTFTIGGDLTVYRLGFGTMRLTGPGIWGPPADKQEAIAVLHRALELGVNLLDTADSYGPEVSRVAHCRSALPLSERPGHRDQRRSLTYRPWPMASRRTPRTSSRGAGGQPAASAPRSH